MLQGFIKKRTQEELEFKQRLGLNSRGTVSNWHFTTPFNVPAKLPASSVARILALVCLGTVPVVVVSQAALAMAFKNLIPVENHIMVKMDERLGKTLTDESGERFFVNLNEDPSEPLSIKFDFSNASGDTRQYAADLLVFAEDRGAGKEFSPFRYNGLDLRAIAVSIPGLFTDEPSRGASTLPVQLCSTWMESFHIKKNWHGYRTKAKEFWCAMKLDSQIDGDYETLIRLAGTHLPMVRGQKNGSNWGAPVHGFELAAQTVFGKKFDTINRCQAAVLVASIKKQVVMTGDLHDKTIALESFEKTKQRAKFKADQMADEFGYPKLTCWNSVVHPETKGVDVVNPARTLPRALGSSYSQTITNMRMLGGDQFSTKLNVNAQIEGRKKVTEAFCEFNKPGVHFNFCPKNGNVNAQANVTVVDSDGNLRVHHAFGPGAEQVLYEPNHGKLPSRGSVGKSSFLVLGKGRELCPKRAGNIHDPNGFSGYLTCTEDQHVTVRQAYKASQNLSILDMLNTSAPDTLKSLKTELGYDPDATPYQMALGVRTLSVQRLIGAYSAQMNLIDGKPAIGSEPKAIVESVRGDVDLTSFYHTGDGDWVRSVLSAPTQAGGTAAGFSRRARANGINILTAKTGTSEAGRNGIRGKHIIGSYRNTSGETLTFYIEVASPDSRPLMSIEHISTSSLADILIAATK